MVLTCRFYEQRFPEIDDVVMVNVRSIADMGAYVHLLEYNNIEGMILLSELSRRRIRYCGLMSISFEMFFKIKYSQVHQQIDTSWQNRTSRGHPSGQRQGIH